MRQFESVRIIQTTCDIYASGVGAVCLLGAVSLFRPSFYPMLLWMSIALGGVAGVMFGLTKSKAKRRIAGYMIWVMCLLQLAVQLRLFAIGAYSAVALQMTFYSVLALVLLLCWATDHWLISKRTLDDPSLTLKQSLGRLFCGLICCAIALTLVATMGVVPSMTIPHRLLALLQVIWYLAFASCSAIEVWRLTGEARHHNPLGVDNKSGSKQLFLIGFCCMVIASAGYNMQQGKPTYTVAVPMVILAAITAIVIARHDFDCNESDAALSAS